MYLAIALLALTLQNAPRTAPPSSPPSAPSNGDAPTKVVERGPIAGLLLAESRPVQIASGFRFTEGPAADPDGHVYFVDVVSARVLKLNSLTLDAAKAATNSEEVVINNGSCYGLMFAADGTLVATQGGSSKGALIKIDRATKAMTTLASELAIDGVATPFGRVNDLAIDAEGGIYFTDPSLGRTPSPTRGIMYRATSGAVTRVDQSITAPNGVRLSADGKTLYALSYRDPGVYRFPVTSPGVLGPPERFASLVGSDGVRPRGRGDGFAIDERGNLWCTNPDVSEVQVIAPTGELLGRIGFPEPPTNCAFGGPDGRTLVVTAVTSVYALRTEVAGTWLARKQSTTSGASATTSPANAPGQETR